MYQLGNQPAPMRSITIFILQLTAKCLQIPIECLEYSLTNSYRPAEGDWASLLQVYENQPPVRPHRLVHLLAVMVGWHISFHVFVASVSYICPMSILLWTLWSSVKRFKSNSFEYRQRECIKRYRLLVIYFLNYYES